MKGIWNFMVDLNCFFMFLLKRRQTPPSPACFCCLTRAGRTLCANTHTKTLVGNSQQKFLTCQLLSEHIPLFFLLSSQLKTNVRVCNPASEFRILKILLPGWRIFNSCPVKRFCLGMRNQKKPPKMFILLVCFLLVVCVYQTKKTN